MDQKMDVTDKRVIYNSVIMPIMPFRIETKSTKKKRGLVRKPEE